MSAPLPQFPRGLKRRLLGVSHGFFWAKIRPQLTAYEIEGVYLFDVAEAEGLIKLRSSGPRSTPRNSRMKGEVK
jgi:hypothetical protein